MIYMQHKSSPTTDSYPLELTQKTWHKQKIVTSTLSMLLLLSLLLFCDKVTLVDHEPYCYALPAVMPSLCRGQSVPSHKQFTKYKPKYRWIRQFQKIAGQYCSMYQANLSVHHQSNCCQVSDESEQMRRLKTNLKRKKKHWLLRHLQRDPISRIRTTEEKTLLEIVKGGWWQLSSWTKQKQKLSFQQIKLAKVEGPSVTFCLKMDKVTEF